MSGDRDHSHGSIRSAAGHKGRLAAAFGLLAVFIEPDNHKGCDEVAW